MCGRFSLTLPTDAVGRLFGVADPPVLTPRYNIAPSQDIAVVRARRNGAGRELVLMQWGFIPAWVRDPASTHRPINARAETVMGKPMFRDAFRHRRCLIPADGFYEWRKVAGGKQPCRIVRADGAPLAFAGLWEAWTGRDGQTIVSCTIITTEANETVRPVHDRMPVILDIGRFSRWLEDSAAAASALMEPYRGRLSVYPVSRRVNDPTNDDAGLVEPVASDVSSTSPSADDPEPTLF